MRDRTHPSVGLYSFMEWHHSDAGFFEVQVSNMNVDDQVHINIYTHALSRAYINIYTYALSHDSDADNFEVQVSITNIDDEVYLNFSRMH